MPELSVIIPARNEIFLSRTIENLLENIRGDTEIITICDGYWPTPPIHDHPKVNLIHYSASIGQRAATNQGVRLSRAKYIMKVDAHCAFDEGFDVKLMEEIDYDWTVIPRMYNLHAFDWVCRNGHRRYQSPSGPCAECGETMEKDIAWKPRLNRRTDFARFDNTLHFQYWSKYAHRPEAKGDVVDVMSHVGACWMMHRDRFIELGGCDEKHGSWGQMGTEVSCQTWLSGGRQVVNKKTWFSHMFRTQGKDFGFPYHLPQSDVEVARAYSKDLWMNGKYEKQELPLSWLLEKFWPIPEWTEEDLENQRRREYGFGRRHQEAA